MKRLSLGGESVYFERKAVNMIDVESFKELLGDNGERFPLLTLDEFFEEIRRRIPLPRINGSLAGLLLVKCGSC